MAKLEEKIRESVTAFTLYREGAFWIAYEHSAWFLHKAMGYKPICRFYKVLQMRVVKVGFPTHRLQAVLGQIGLAQPSKEQLDMEILVFTWPEAIDSTAFTIWRKGLADTLSKGKHRVKERGHKAVQDILLRIRSYPLVHRSPYEAFLFLKDVQEACLQLSDGAETKDIHLLNS